MSDLPEHETAVDIIARALAAVSPNQRLEALRRFETRARKEADLASLRALKQYRDTNYPAAAKPSPPG